MFRKHFVLIYTVLYTISFVSHFIHKLTRIDLFSVISLFGFWLAMFLYIIYFLKYKEIRMLGVNYKGKEGILFCV